jgi:HEAT repeat protein
VQKVGTNALPMLVRMLRAKDGRFARHLWRIREGHPILKTVVPMKPPVSGFVNNVRALAALNELGPLAAPAIPKILPMLGDPDRAHVAMAAILSIQPELESDILSLTNVLRIKQTSISGASPSLQHSSAILALSTFGPKARGAIPVLLDCLHSTNGRVRGSAAIALARTGAPVDKVLPWIMADLPQSNPPPLHPTFPPTVEDWRNWKMDILALAEFGPKARAALPILSNLQSYPMINLQNAASEAAAIIQREDNRGKR